MIWAHLLWQALNVGSWVSPDWRGAEFWFCCYNGYISGQWFSQVTVGLLWRLDWRIFLSFSVSPQALPHWQLLFGPLCVMLASGVTRGALGYPSQSSASVLVRSSVSRPCGWVWWVLGGSFQSLPRSRRLSLGFCIELGAWELSW